MLIETKPVKPSKYLREGNKYQQKGNLYRAIECYQKAIALNPDLVPALSKLATIYRDSKDYRQAFIHYLKIIGLRPKKPIFSQELVKVSVNYSKLLLKENNLDNVITAYKEFFRQKLPQKVDNNKIDQICNMLGEVIIKLSVRQGQFATATTCFQEAIDNYLYKEWSYYHLGNVLAKEGKIDEAIAAYEKAVEVKPEFYQSLVKLGKLLLKKGRRNKAFQYGLKILQNQGHFKNPRLNSILNKLLSVNFDRPKSKEALQKVIEQIESSNPNPGAIATTYMSIGTILRDRGDFLEATDFYRKSLYYQFQKSQPEFVKRYWDIGKYQEPDFLVIGFGKCGTTAFYDYLCQHPQVLPAVRKEPFSLSKLVRMNENFKEKDWSLLSSERDWYLAHFAPRPKEKCFITGEASTSNIIPGVEKIIASWFPSIKLVALIREPVKRTISHYEERLKIDRQRGSLNEVINSELDELEATTNLAQTVTENLKKGWREHIAMSLYFYPLERWMKFFPKEQFLILTNEELAQYPEQTMKQAFDFLDLPDCNSIEYHPRNVGAYPQIDADLLSRLSKFFRPHNQRLEEFLDRKFNWDK